MYIADLHIHSKFSRATSKECDLEHLDIWAGRKGIQLLGTGDFTHPVWRGELMEKLQPAEDGLYTLKEEYRIPDELNLRSETPRFVLSGEISSIYKKNGRVRKVHNVILLPSLEAADVLAKKLEAIGNVHSDGRPILGLDSRDLLEITLEACPDAVFIPAHIWTPHFSLFGAFSGFDTIEECFEDLTPHIHALETGLSSDPPMNWRLSSLDRYHLVSNSDAHSPQKLGREANLLDTALSYPALSRALENGTAGGLAGTIEFFPEEGKYHYDGHRNCQLCLTPQETIALGSKCPVCGKKITIGVQHRVEQLADRPENYRRENPVPFESLVPLPEVIAASTGKSNGSVVVQRQYLSMLQALGAEFPILRSKPLEEIERAAGPLIAKGISRLRRGKVTRSPGFDGEYGKIQLLSQDEIDRISGQFTWFLGGAEQPKKKASKKNINLSAKHAQAETAAEIAPPPIPVRLNAEQQRAAGCLERAAAIIAGPGTGKTKTLVSHIIYLVENQNVNPREITAVTFTNKAANELKERLEEHFGKKRLRGLTVGTFHSICRDLLLQWGSPLLLADEYTMRETAGKVIRALELSCSTRQLLQRISNRKSGDAAQDDTDTAFDKAFDLYQSTLKEMGRMDFDDLLLEVLEGWESHSSSAPRFAHLMVDEFQDVNPIQYRLITSWNRQGKSLFVIGDPDQSIYGFRGSDAHCFDRMRQEYPGLTTIRLTQNYRSTPEILQCALPLISKNEGGPRLLNAQKASGAPVALLTGQSDLSCAIFIAKEINRMVGGIDMLDAYDKEFAVERACNRSFSDIAILYRTHRQADLLEKCLQKESIPYIVAGRDDYLSEADVRAALDFFRFVWNPKDLTALSSYLTLTGWAEEAAAQAAAVFAGCGSPAALNKMEMPDSPALQKLFHLIQQFASKTGKTRPDKLVELWLSQTGTDTSEAMERLQRTVIFYPTIPAFLEALTLGQECDLMRCSSNTYSADAVTLMTLHGAKGLEFPAVFLYGVNQGKIPMEAAHFSTDLEEERRLFYVGLTRAKEELFLLTNGVPSPFLEDIPSETLTKTTLQAHKEPTQGVQLCLFKL